MRIKKSLLLIIALCSVTSASPFFGKKTLLKNDTKTSLYGAVYYTNSSYALRAANPFAIQAGATMNVDIPMGKPFKSRNLFLEADSEKLPAKIDVTDADAMPSIPSIKIGLGHPSKLSIVDTDAGIAVRPTDEHAAQQARKQLRTAVARQSKKYGIPARVKKYEGGISPQEKDFMHKRRSVITKTIRRYIGEKINVAYIPHISLCASGGGMRATLTALGVLKGLEKLGLTNSLDYMTGVSGGTWTIACWIAEQTSVSEHIERLSTRLESVPSHPTLIKQSLDEHKSLGYKKALFGHGSGLADIVGICLSRTLLKPIDPFYRKLTLSDLSSRLHPAQHPFPICTAVTPRPQTNKSFHWLEFSPYDVRIVTGDYAIPSWSFMRRFKNGSSIDFMPEPHLGYSMALWGSAFSLSIEDMLTKSPIKFNKILPKSLIKSVASSKAGRSKQFAALIPNPLYQLDGASPELKNKQLLPVIDAAHHNNLPIIPLLHAGRHQDILILVNASTAGSNDMRSIYQTRKMLRDAYPGIQFNVDKALGQPFTFWPSEKMGVPHIIHISLHKMDSFDPEYYPTRVSETKTINIRYTPEQVNKLTGLAEHIILHNKDTIKKAIASAIAKREFGTGKIDWLLQNVSSWFA